MCFYTHKHQQSIIPKQHIEYFEDTKIIKKTYYLTSDNALHGEYKEYRQNGMLWIHCWYHHDQHIKTYKQYDINGELWHHYVYTDEVN